MKSGVFFSDRWVASLAFGFALALAFVPSITFAEQGVFDQLLQTPIAVYEQADAVARKSQKGTIEAMQDAPPPEKRDAPFSQEDLQRIKDKNTAIRDSNQQLAKAQQDLANRAAELLGKLPPNHPRYTEVQNRLKEIAFQMPDTQQQLQIYKNKVAESDAALNKWRQNHDPTYVPPKVTAASPAPATVDAPAEPPPQPPPKTDDGGNTNDGGIAALKQKEVAQEAAARELGKERQSAVNRYLDDPSAENHAEAEALRARLDGMVDDLNALRGQVDEAEGTSRPRIHIRSAKAIAEEHRRRRQSGTNTDGAENNPPSGGGCAMGTGPGGEQHNPDGSDTSSSYQDVGPNGGSGTGAGGKGQHSGRGTRRKGQSKAVSSQGYQRTAGGNESHHHAANGVGGMRNQNLQAQKFQQQNKMHQQQLQQQHQQQLMQQQQQQQQQQRKRHRKTQ